MVEVNAKQRKLQKLLAQQVKRGEEIVFLLFLFSKAINFWHVFTLFSRKKNSQTLKSSLQQNMGLALPKVHLFLLLHTQLVLHNSLQIGIFTELMN